MSKKVFDYELFFTQCLLLLYGITIVFLLLYVVFESIKRGDLTQQALNHVYTYALLFWTIPLMLLAAKCFEYHFVTEKKEDDIHE